MKEKGTHNGICIILHILRRSSEIPNPIDLLINFNNMG